MTDYQRHGRRRVIGLVLAGCVLVGGLGAVAGEVFDPPAEHPRKARTHPDLGVTVTPGNAAPGARPAGVLRLDGTTQDPNLTGVEYDIGYGARIFIPSDWEVTQTADTRIWAIERQGQLRLRRRRASTPTRLCGPVT